MNPIAERELAACRRILATSPALVPVEVEWWDGLRIGERRTLLRHAGFDPERGSCPWRHLSDAECAGVLQSAHRAVAWGRMLRARLQRQRGQQA